jgi:hypothetical protein
VCDNWHHTSCVGVEDKEYEVLTKASKGGKQFHWFCKECNTPAIEMLRTIKELKAKNDKIEKELIDTRHEIDNMGKQLNDGLDQFKVGILDLKD